MIEFNTRYFEFAHGKKPRGYGMWMFEFRYGGKVERIDYAACMYSEAKKMARADARFRRCNEVVVCS